RAWLIKSNMAVGAYAQQLVVRALGLVKHLGVALTFSSQVLSFAIGQIDLRFGNAHMAKEVMAHVIVVALRMRFAEAYVFVQVKSGDLRKCWLGLVNQLNKCLVNGL